MNEKILKRMRNLLAMSRDATSDNEAEIAMKRLHSMLAKHNVSMVDIDGPEGIEKAGKSGFNSYVRPWHKAIVQGVSKLYFCKSYYHGRGRKVDVMIVGTEINREFAMGMVKSILHSVNIQSQHAANSRHPKGPQWSSFQTSFLNSASLTIYHRCEALIKAAQQGETPDGDGGTLPVLASVYDTHWALCDEVLAKMDMIPGRRSKFQMKNAAGYYAGKDAGNKVQLTRSLQKENQQKALT